MENFLALEITNLSKEFKTKQNTIHALKNISLNVNKGEIFGLLGPNGAGKSTFINILAGTVIKSSGSVKVWNFDLDKNPREVRSSIGIVPQETNLDPFFSPRKLLEIQAGMYGIKESERITDKILEITMLKDKADSYARSLSGGMKRRLLVAKALVHRPPILILDEPTASNGIPGCDNFKVTFTGTATLCGCTGFTVNSISRACFDTEVGNNELFFMSDGTNVREFIRTGITFDATSAGSCTSCGGPF